MFQYPLYLQVYERWIAQPDGRHAAPTGSCFRFSVRALTRREYQDWRLAYASELEFEDRVVRETVLEHPPVFQGELWDWDRVPAGLPSQIAQAVLTLSGFGAEPDPGIVQRAEEYLLGGDSRCDQLIMAAFSGYRLEDLLDMQPELYQRVIGLAYRHLKSLGLDPDGILNPDQKKRRGAIPPPGPPPQIQGFPQGGDPMMMAKPQNRPSVQTYQESENFTFGEM